MDSRIFLPVGRVRIELLDHGGVGRVERLGPIEGDHPQRPWVAVSTSRADSSTVIGYPLLQRRHDKLGAGADALRPAQRRSLEARVEAHDLRPMHVMVAKQIGRASCRERGRQYV